MYIIQKLTKGFFSLFECLHRDYSSFFSQQMTLDARNNRLLTRESENYLRLFRGLSGKQSARAQGSAKERDTETTKCHAAAAALAQESFVTHTHIHT